MYAADQAPDLSGRGQHPIRQVLDLIRNHREGLAVFTGLSSNDCCIQREETRLVCYVIDHVDNRADLLGPPRETPNHLLGNLSGFANGIHALDRLANLHLPVLCTFDYQMGKPCRLLRISIDLTQGARHLAHRGRRFRRRLRQ